MGYLVIPVTKPQEEKEEKEEVEEVHEEDFNEEKHVIYSAQLVKESKSKMDAKEDSLVEEELKAEELYESKVKDTKRKRQIKKNTTHYDKDEFQHSQQVAKSNCKNDDVAPPPKFPNIIFYWRCRSAKKEILRLVPVGIVVKIY